MKLTKQKLKEIILEEMGLLKENEREKDFGSEFVSSSERARGLKQSASDVMKKSGVDTKEQGMIVQIEKVVSELAELTDIKSGPAASILRSAHKRLHDLLQLVRAEQKGN